MSEPVDNSTEINTLLAPPTSEKFSWKLASIVTLIHIFSLFAFFSISKTNIVALILSHIFFATFGISLGLHRLFSHRSFSASKSITRFFAVVSTLCFQGGPVFWALSHRNHHRFTESYGDPHSAARGFLWSHLLWMFYLNPNGFSYPKSLKFARDLRKDSFIVWLEVNSTKFNLAFLVFIGALCWAIGNPGLALWIGPLRIVTVWHSTWLINSYAHRARFWKKWEGKSLRNSTLMTVILGGEGNHDYHHRHPSMTRHTNKNFHIDYGFWILRMLKTVGLVEYRAPVKENPVERFRKAQ